MPTSYTQLLSHLQKLEEQLNVIKEELTLTREGIKEAKNAIIRLESQIGSSSP